MSKIKIYKKEVYCDSQGIEHPTLEAAEKAQKSIDKVTLTAAFLEDVKKLPSIQACCTRAGIANMTAEQFVRIIFSDLENFRNLCNKALPAQRKVMGTTQEVPQKAFPESSSTYSTGYERTQQEAIVLS